ncbi:MAG: AMP-binding protein [Burkholderiales bacterium]
MLSIIPSTTPALTDITDYRQALDTFSWDRLWALFDGTPEHFNLATECLDRHAARGTAIAVKFSDGHVEQYGFAELALLTAKFANWLVARGAAPGDRVAVMLEPGRAFYTALFGAVKRGAIAVPLFTLFGPDGIALRVADCTPRLLLVEPGRAASLRGAVGATELVEVDAAFWAEVDACVDSFTPTTKASDLAVFQYTSGTTRELPEAVKHSHRAIVTLMIAALYGVGLRPGDRYFCPSSPAWGHGLWHGTIAPLALGVQIGSYSGKFEVERIFEALQELQITNFAAAATVYRMMRNAGLRDRYRLALQKVSYTGEPMDSETYRWVESAFNVTPASMYGTTEVGVLIVNYPGYSGYRIKPGTLGKPAPGWEVAVVDRDGRELPPDEQGEIAVRRKGEWFFVKDRGVRDAEGYFIHHGRSDDVIISAGWTMSAVEIEDALMKHPAVLEAAAIGVPDQLRGHVVKALLVTRDRTSETEQSVKRFMKETLGQHEYPRIIEFVDALPKTPAGKVNRKVLRDREAAQSSNHKKDPQ